MRRRLAAPVHASLRRLPIRISRPAPIRSWTRALAAAFPFALLLIAPLPSRAAWRTFTAADGLGSNEVNSVIQDRSENLWFATALGVARFDGSTWRRFTPADGLGAGPVRDVYEDREGYVWAATGSGGASRFDGATWRSFTTTDGLASDRVRQVLEDRDGGYWFPTPDGVSRYRPGAPAGQQWRTFTTADGLAGNSVFCVAEDRRGDLWFGTLGSGASRFDPSANAWTTFDTMNGLSSDSVSAIREDRNGALWFTTWGGGVCRFDSTGWRAFTTADGVASLDAFGAFEDRDGSLWFGSGDAALLAGAGVSRFDGAEWRVYTTADGLAGDVVPSLCQDLEGNLWFATAGGGASRYDGSSWRAYTTADGLADPQVTSIAEDRAHRVWAGTWGGGVSRFDGVSWTTFAPGDGPPEGHVSAALVDRAGAVWFGTGDGVARFGPDSTWAVFHDELASPDVAGLAEDCAGRIWVGTRQGVSRFDPTDSSWISIPDAPAGAPVEAILDDCEGDYWLATFGAGVYRRTAAGWDSFTTADGLADDDVWSILEDRSGRLWFGTEGGGVSVFDQGAWRTYTTGDGLAGNDVRPILEDRSGKLWFGSRTGFSVSDGTTWRSFSPFARSDVRSLLEDHAGNLWFGTVDGLYRFEPDRVPPRTVFRAAPAALSTSRNPAAQFEALGEPEGIEFSYRLDGGPWSAWSPQGAWSGGGVSDGAHELEVRSRDGYLNVEPTPAVAAFEIDATPPAPVISSPLFGLPVRGVVEVRGTAADPRFTGYRVEARPAGAAVWDAPPAQLIVASGTPVTEGLLARWDSTALPDGLYDLRVSVTDSLGLTGAVQVAVLVDNLPPYADETAPARVTASSGGDVYAADAKAHLYFPPHGFTGDAVVAVTALDRTTATDTLSNGAVLVDPGVEIAWSGAALRKPARLELAFPAGTAPGSGPLALYAAAGGATWARAGGSVSVEGDRISLPLRVPGRYALYRDAEAPGGPRTVSGLSFSPRVFSPSGTYADRHVGIGFTLGRPSAVTVKVYSRTGRLVRVVASGLELGAGSNLVPWDGRDREGAVVSDDLYLVTVEAFGQTMKKTLAVVK